MKEFLSEAFQKLDLLESEDFDLYDQGAIEEIKDFKDEDANTDIMNIIDGEAETEEDLKDSYVGKVIVECNVCHSLLYKDKEDLDFCEDGSCVNEGEECPVCFSNGGFSVVGQVEPYEEVEVTITDKEEDSEEDKDELPKADEEEKDKEEVEESLNESTEFKTDTVDNIVNKAADVLNGQNGGAVVGTVASLLASDEAEKDSQEDLDEGILGAIGAAAAAHPVATALGAGALAGGIAGKLASKKDESCNNDLEEGKLGDIANKALNVVGLGRTFEVRDDKGNVIKSFNNESDANNFAKNYSKWNKDSDVNVKSFRNSDERSIRKNFNKASKEYAKSAPEDPNKDSVMFDLKADQAFQDKVDAFNANRPTLKHARRINHSNFKNGDANESLKEDLQLPNNLYISASELALDSDDEYYDDDLMGDVLGDIISDKVGYCHYGFDYEVDKDKEGMPIGVNVTNIQWDTNESLKEDLNNIELDTESQHIEIKSTPKEDNPDAEMIAPIDDNTINDMMDEDNAEDEEEVEEEDNMIDYPMDEFDEESFNELGESYLKNVYENVSSYKTTGISEKNDKIFVEGLINFKSGNSKKTSFIFEAKDADRNSRVRLIGENAQITRGRKAFTITGNVNNGKFISESLNYNYRQKNTNGKSTRVYGTVRV